MGLNRTHSNLPRRNLSNSVQWGDSRRHTPARARAAVRLKLSSFCSALGEEARALTNFTHTVTSR